MLYFSIFRFFERFGMPGVIGLIDCTHVSIIRPAKETEQSFYAVRKASHTKNVQIVSLKWNYNNINLTNNHCVFSKQICDFNLSIRSIYPRFGGSSHDSFIWNGCGIRAMLADEYGTQPRNSWLLGKLL